MATKDYRVRVYTPGSTGTSSSGVDFTLTAALNQPVTVHYPRIRPLTGRVETRPYEVSVVDVGSSMTAYLADSSGRTDMINRLVTIDESRDSGASYTQLGVGRVGYVRLGADVATYQIGIEDETRAARVNTLFASSNTTRIWPGGPHSNYGPFKAPNKGWGLVIHRPSANQAAIDLRGSAIPIMDQALSQIEDDIKPDYEGINTSSTKGSFTHTRVRIGNTDYEVQSFVPVNLITVQPAMPPGMDPLLSLRKNREEGMRPYAWLIATSSQLGVGDEISSAFIHMFSHAASPATPLHIGTSDGIAAETVIANVLSGTYSSTDVPAIRYSTAALDAIAAERTRPRARWRITGPARAQEWLEDNVYGPLGIAPLIDSSGRIAPQSLWLGNSTSSDFTFTGANLRTPHPTWQNTDDEHVTVLSFRYTHEEPFYRELPELIPVAGLHAVGSADHIKAVERTAEREHDRISYFGRFVHEVNLSGYHTDGYAGQEARSNKTMRRLQDAMDVIQRETFDRFGDGPQTGTLHSLSTGEAVTPGNFVTVSLETYPCMSSAPARGATRRLQILSKSQTPRGPDFEYLDAGPNTQVSNPTITLAGSTRDPKHTIYATVASVPSGGGFQVQINASSSEPSTGDSGWFHVYTSAETSGTYPITQLPSNNYWWGRVRGVKSQRIRSTWVNSTDYQQTSGLSGPTSISATGSLSKKQALVTWTVGESAYPLTIHVDSATSGTLGDDNLARVLMPGSNRYTVRGLSTAEPSSGTYLVGVRHYDSFGGVSSFCSTTFDITSASAASTAPDMLGLRILWGEAV